MPLVGRDWTQSGVARLFSAIKVCFLSNINLLKPGVARDLKTNC